jgi:hypothetical protein
MDTCLASQGHWFDPGSRDTFSFYLGCEQSKGINTPSESPSITLTFNGVSSPFCIQAHKTPKLPSLKGTLLHSST